MPVARSPFWAALQTKGDQTLTAQGDLTTTTLKSTNGKIVATSESGQVKTGSTTAQAVTLTAKAGSIEADDTTANEQSIT